MQLICGDSLTELDRLTENSIDAVVTDPPYALVSIQKRFGSNGAKPNQYGTDGVYARASRGFMGCAWDNGDVAFNPDFWAKVLRVLKPGGHCLAFGGTRTYHRLVCAIEDAGFEVRDMIAYHYGSGFPKSHNVPGGFGSALKPATEPICVARKPLSESSLAKNFDRWGTGLLNIDACRIPTQDRWQATGRQSAADAALCGGVDGSLNISVSDSHPDGRWPANAVFDEHMATVLDEQSGFSRSNGTRDSRGRNYQAFTNEQRQSLRDDIWHGANDEGGASRFFFTAKASTAERNGGCGGRAPVIDLDGRASAIDNPFQRGETPRLNTHPTVKPLSLMTWLCRLVTPPAGTVLDPFMGSGSTGCAAVRDGFGFVGIEREPEYFEIASDRINFAALQPRLDLFDTPASAVRTTEGHSQPALFDESEAT